MSKINITDINATGTPSHSTALLGDGSWGTVSGGGGTGSAPQTQAILKLNPATSGYIDKSYNVSSVTKTGVGLYRVNFTTPFADSDYLVISGEGKFAAYSNYDAPIVGIDRSGTQAPGYCDIQITYASGWNGVTDDGAVLIQFQQFDPSLGTGGSGGGGGGSIPLIDGVPVMRPALSALTWMNQGGATAIDYPNGPISMMVTAQSGDQLRGLEVSTFPSEPWTYTCKLAYQMFAENYYTAGLYIRDASGKLVTWNFGYGAATLQFTHWNSVTSFNNQPYSRNVNNYSSIWLRIHYDGTNFIGYVSQNGQDWISPYQESATAFIGTPAAIGVYGDNNDAYGVDSVVSIWSWELVSGNGTNSSTGSFSAKPWDFNPPTAAQFTLFNNTGSDLVLTDDPDAGLLIDFGTPVTGDHGRLGLITLPNPATPWTMIAKFSLTYPNYNYNTMGLVCQNSSALNWLIWGFDDQGSWRYLRLNNGGYGGYTPNINNSRTVQWLKMSYDGTNINMYVSADGKNWLLAFQEATSVYLGAPPDKVGFGIDSNRSGGPNVVGSIQYWSLTGGGL